MGYFLRLFYFLTFVFIVACNSRTSNTKTKDLFFYSNKNNLTFDTLTRENIYRHESKDSLIYEQDFEFNGKSHSIKMFSSDFYAPTDGGQLTYELDSLGIIYSRSTTWYSYQRLKSNNDSLNLIIDAALENIILYPSLHCYHCELQPVLETIKFIPPVVDEEKKP